MMYAVGMVIGFMFWMVWSFIGLIALLSYLDDFKKMEGWDHISFWLFMVLGAGYTDWYFGWGS